jgi:ABC-type antimicrobial peptide transport system permease subunit
MNTYQEDDEKDEKDEKDGGGRDGHREQRPIWWKLSGGLTGMYVTWICVHYGAVHLYSVYCAPLSMRGFFSTMFLAPAPHCELLRRGIQLGGDGIGQVWKSTLNTATMAAVASATAMAVIGMSTDIWNRVFRRVK